MKKALVIGIDDYDYGAQPLQCCVSDAQEMKRLLQFNADDAKSTNFDVQLLTSETGDVSNRGLVKAVSRFFRSSVRAEVAVLYFAGHGVVHPSTDAGYLVGADGGPDAWGLSLWELLGLANEAHDTITSSVIILDCCHAGELGEWPGSGGGGSSMIGKGVTILSSCSNDEKAAESGRHGIFTDLLLDGLGGACADLCGNVTPASLYAHIDQALGAFDQRPLYKANVQRFVPLRQVLPRISLDVLRMLPIYFPEAEMVYQLDPRFEPDRKNVPDQFKDLPVDEERTAIFDDLQQYNRQGLVVPVGYKHMYFAAINSGGCKLTAVGKHYRRLAMTDKL